MRLARAMVGAATAASAYSTFASPYSQLLGRFPHRLATTEKVVALTFDDGPNEPYTSQLGDLLAREQVLATFFQVGQCVERWPGATARLAQDGHAIGNHSWSHRVTRCVGHRHIRDETVRTSALLADVTGRAPTLYRPPWLLRTPSHFRVWSELGLAAVSGSFCHPLEIFQPSPEVIARASVAQVRPGSILIFHDGYNATGGDRAHTVAAVALVITALRAQGYRFVTVDPSHGVIAAGTAAEASSASSSARPTPPT